MNKIEMRKIVDFMTKHEIERIELVKVDDTYINSIVKFIDKNNNLISEIAIYTMDY